MVLITLLAIISFLRKKDPGIIFGKYSQQGKWFYLKYVVLICFLYIRMWCRSNKVQTENGTNLKKIFCFGANAQGWRFAISRARQYPHQGIADTVLHIVVPDRGLLQIPQRSIVTCEIKENSAKKWKIMYRGDLLSNGTVVKNCVFEGEFVKQRDLIDLKTDISIKAAARTIAMEPWSVRFFRDLRDYNSSHTEQMGKIRGSLFIDGGTYNIDLEGCLGQISRPADDRFSLHRYVSFVFFLENGTLFSLSHICRPGTGSNTQIGYIVFPSGKYAPIDSSDFEMFQHGEKGSPPKECAFQLEADGQLFMIQVQVEDEAEHFFGKKNRHRIAARFMQVQVNGVCGHGVSEFYYNTNGDRP